MDLALPDGLWRTFDKLGSFRLTVADPQNRSIGFLAKGLENGAPVLIGTRLRVINHQITEMESVVARLSSTQGGSSFGTPKEASINDEPRKQFLTDLPAAARRTPAQLAAIVNGYFTGLEGNTGRQAARIRCGLPPPGERDADHQCSGCAGCAARSGATCPAPRPLAWVTTTRTRGCEIAAFWRWIPSAGWYTPACFSITTQRCAVTSSRTAARSRCAIRDPGPG